MLASHFRCCYQRHLVPFLVRRNPLRFQSVCSAPALLPAAKAAEESESPFVKSTSVTKIVQTQHGEVEVDLPKVCFGCGVRLQDKDPDKPGFYNLTERLLEKLLQEQMDRGKEDEPVSETQTETEAQEEKPEADVKDMSEDEKFEMLDAMLDAQAASPQKKEQVTYVVEDDDQDVALRCARCYSLMHYGKVKSTLGESFLPEFNLGKKVGRKIALQKGRRAVILCVVDVTDFDGSLPRAALQELIPEGPSVPGMGCKLVLAVNKVDLMPKPITKARLEIWVRTRGKDGGLPPLASVHLVSSVNMLGVQDLLHDVIQKVGVRGDLWVVGAQNAGKSSLINALKQATGTSGTKDLTTAPLPGTTLGVVEVKGLPMPRKCHVYDTPGVKHGFQLTTIVSPVECEMLLPKRPLVARTFRTASGYTLLIAGVARLDVVSCPSASIYITFWAADQLQCHLGKTEGAEERFWKFAGRTLKPPENESRVEDLGALQPIDIEIVGSSWKKSTKDICFAGLGWFGIGVSGPAKFVAWSLKGAQITVRDSLMPDFAKTFETPGMCRSVHAGGVSRKKKGGKRRK
ncbi:hypothetical protein BSKO_06276 [Bryopsis sp. KO-2023]|nr:hypothetical protein BSKO_06276 [Bryopsis sp. KO-2023]